MFTGEVSLTSEIISRKVIGEQASRKALTQPSPRGEGSC